MRRESRRGKITQKSTGRIYQRKVTTQHIWQLEPIRDPFKKFEDEKCIGIIVWNLKFALRIWFSKLETNLRKKREEKIGLTWADWIRNFTTRILRADKFSVSIVVLRSYFLVADTRFGIISLLFLLRLNLTLVLQFSNIQLK